MLSEKTEKVVRETLRRVGRCADIVSVYLQYRLHKETRDEDEVDITVPMPSFSVFGTSPKPPIVYSKKPEPVVLLERDRVVRVVCAHNNTLSVDGIPNGVCGCWFNRQARLVVADKPVFAPPPPDEEEETTMMVGDKKRRLAMVDVIDENEQKLKPHMARMGCRGDCLKCTKPVEPCLKQAWMLGVLPSAEYESLKGS